ncbi:MAG: ROK family protein [Chloroflexi bacterium]|nr:ROK family protein [Chloroflexota bacterium]
MTDGDVFAGIDLGGTKILVLVTNAHGNVLGDARVATQASGGVEAVIGRMVQATREAAAEAKVDLAAIRAIGISAPGPIDTAEGVITDPPNLPGWHNVHLVRMLRERFARPVVLENDANCQGVAEHQFGAGRGYRHMIFLTISTGIGGGIIIDNELYTGASGAAGELGHVAVATEGPVCGAGHVGCLEAFASGTAIARQAQDLIDAGRLPRTARIAEHNPPLDAEDVYRASQEGEAEAGAIIERAGRYLGIGLASMMNAFNPQAIVLGGGMMNMGEAVMGPAIEVARQRAFGQAFADAQVLEGTLGERAGALGAIAVAKHRVETGVL